MESEKIMQEPSSEETSSDFRKLSVDDRFKLLKNSRRRKIIKYLSEHRDPTTRSELAEIIAADEIGIPVSDLGSDQRKRVYVSLYQTHLPTLKRDEVIRYDSSRGTVEPGPNMDELVRYLRGPSESRGMPQSTHYIALGLLGGLAYALIRANGEVILWLIDLWALGLVMAFILLSVGHRFGVVTRLGHSDSELVP